MALNKMRRSREGGGGGAESIVCRPGSHRRGSCYHQGMFASLQKHEPAHFFLLNPEVIPPPRTPQLQFSVFPRWGYQQTTVKLEGLCLFFSLSPQWLNPSCFQGHFFYTNLPLFLTPAPKTTNTDGKHNKGGGHSARIGISSAQLWVQGIWRGPWQKF